MSGTQVEITLLKDDDGRPCYTIEAWPVSRAESWSTEWEGEETAGMSNEELRDHAIAQVLAAGYKPPFTVRWKRMR